MMNNEIRVFGSPGCGKTTYLSRLIHKQAKKTGSASILVSSFTRTAAEELVGRNLPLDREQVNTLHGHCYHALGKPEIANSKIKEFNEEFGANLSSDGGTNIDENILDANFTTEDDLLFSEYNIYRNKMIPKEMWKPQVRAFGEKWEAWKAKHDLIDFTDMIEKAFTDYDEAPNRPRYGFFDEVQDFTLLELSLIRKWGKNMERFYLVGDDDQCLYSFKGAQADAFLFPDINKEQKIILDQSYRVPRKIQKIAMQWIQQVKKREAKVYKPCADREGRIRSIAAGYKNPQMILKDAEKHISAGKTVMFLTSCSYMLGPIIKELRTQGIPFHNPYRLSRGDWNPIRRGTSLRMTATERLINFLKPFNEYYGDQARMWLASELAAWIEVIAAKGILKKKAKEEAKKFAKAFPELEMPINSLLTFFEEEALVDCMDHGLDWFTKSLMQSKAKAFEFPIHVLKKRGIKALEEKPRVIPGTIHSVKGGEADIVYLFPDISKKSFMAMGNGGEADIIRQYYVGMTRAREELVLCGNETFWHVRIR